MFARKRGRLRLFPPGLWRILSLYAFFHLVLFFVAFLFLYPQQGAGDIRLYFRWSSKIFDGYYPYRDFSFQYPPFAWVPFLPPRLLSSSETGYILWFILEMFLLDAVILVTLAAIARQLGRSTSQVLTHYTVAIMALGPVVTRRFDLFPAALVLISLWAFLKGRHTLAWTTLAFGATAKLYPIAISGLFALIYLSRRQYRRLIASAATLVLVSLAVSLPFLPFLDDVRRSLAYHQQRGLQIESTFSSLLMVGKALGLEPVSSRFTYLELDGYRYGNDVVNAPLTSLLTDLSPFLTLVMLSLVYFLYLAHLQRPGGKEREREQLHEYVLVVLLVVLITSSVLSPQFLVWLAPSIALVSTEKPRLLWLFVLVGVLTQYNWPSHFDALVRMEPVPVTVLLTRNALLVTMTVWLFPWRSVPSTLTLGRLKRVITLGIRQHI